MAKLNQIVALEKGVRSRAHEALTKVYQELQKGNLLNGLSKTYQPKDEEGEQLPSESQVVQVRVENSLRAIRDSQVPVYDVIASKDMSNTAAFADVVVDGKALLTAVPVTTLLFLEKEFQSLHTVISKLPTLDPTEQWTYNDGLVYETAPNVTVKTKKVPKSHVLYEATKDHPAQVQAFTEDVTVGYWTTVKHSGAISVARKEQLLARINALLDAVKQAREQANMTEAVEVKIGAAIFGYLLQ